VAASLVQGVYIQEKDRQQKRLWPQALAPHWWLFFHFQLINVLWDDDDRSIFGAVYEFKPSQASCHNHTVHRAPKYVVAFRGTITNVESISQDLKLSLQIFVETLHESSRFRVAMQAVQHTVASGGAANIWLVGHSLGSAIAMLAGKNMAKTNCPIESYLFNPPISCAPIEQIQNPAQKMGIRFVSNVIKAGVAVAVKGHQQRPDPFVLYAWTPYLFVNPDDHICSEYIGHFEQRKKMEEMGAGYIERLAMPNSIGSLVLGARGKNSEPLHLLPSAFLTRNLSPSPDFIQAHGIKQWWRPDLNCQSNLYQFR